MDNKIWVLFSLDGKDILYASENYTNVEQVRYTYMNHALSPYTWYSISEVSTDDERYIEYRKGEREVEEYRDI